jgi:DnaJ family protein A protein 2
MDDILSQMFGGGGMRRE